MKRNNQLALIAVLLTVVVVGFGLYTARGLFSKTDHRRGTGAPEPNASLVEALKALDQGRFQAALEAARRAADSPDVRTQRWARLAEARALSGLGDPKAAGAWSAILSDTAYTAGERAEAAVRIGELRRTASPPDLGGAIAAYREAVEQHAGTMWADRAAVALADAYLADKRPELAEATLTDYLVKAKDPELVQNKMCDVKMAILFSPLVTDVPKCIKYVVQTGDTLAGIAKTYNTTVDLLLESNRIESPQLLQVGTGLKVVTDTFRIVIDKSDNTLSLFCHDTLMKRYRVGTGEYDKTPVGDFKIVSKDVDPTWRGLPHDHPDNILGSRWMRITDEKGTLTGYGIHGTTQPETIGTYKSQGCVRMLNQDVEELFKIVTIGTPVSIVE
jgi:lipoprotein-anchoring transpeptidase ErfK/SrfK